jgi:polysaccharide export outer membrane protein
MSGSRRQLALLLLVASALVGCGGSGENAVTRTAFVEFTPEQKAEIRNGTPTEYRIQRGDVLNIAFPYEEKLNQLNVLVLNDGAISLIGVDRIVVAGRTITEADSVITAAYAKEYREPDLSVIVYESKGQRVYVLGEVNRPGMYDVPSEGIGIVGAVSLAGGFKDTAAKAGTVVVRVTPDGYMCQEVDLSNFGQVAASPLGMVALRPYDIVYIPRSRSGDFYYFSRSVLSGLASITRMAVDIYYLSGGNVGRF